MSKKVKVLKLYLFADSDYWYLELDPNQADFTDMY